MSPPPARPSSPVRLIVNADDFGLTVGVNQAVAELYGAGALSSATLMANGAAFEDAVAQAKSNPGLRVGCHIVLVDGTPVSQSPGIASLLDKRGQLRSSLVRFLIDLHLGRITEEAIAQEATAQIQKIQAAGLQPTHIDTHKHTHLFPQVARPLLQAARQCGILAVRNPFEESWSARLARGVLVRRVEVRLLHNLRRSFFRLIHRLSMATTSGSIGVSATGSLNAPMLRDLLHTAPAGTWELVCHPGYNDAALAAIPTRLRTTRETERLALAGEIPAAIRSGAVELCGFDEVITRA